MKPLAILFVILVSGCCSYVSKQRAVQVATGEINRRNLPLPRDYRVEAVEDTFVAESGPDIPIYVVSFSDPRRREALSVYDVDVNRCTGEVHAVSDLRTSGVFRVGQGGVIEQKQGNKWVPVKAANGDSQRPER